ncbi:MAG: DegT/DnrJ/EryC1/StrS family aminotransferase [Pseudomonadota bacterium]
MKAPEMIPVAGPWITEREVTLTTEAARHGWGPDHYRFNARFESMFAEYVGVRHAVSLPHATSALHLICAALGLGPGDEVIAPDVTWIASVAPITYCGATPVLVDIDPVTWCIDPASVEAAMGPKTRAILGVDLYGSLCDWPALRALADRHGLALIEDAAEALGSTLNGRQAGSFGDAAAFSFHGSKTVATGEGGMLVTDDDALIARVKFLRDHGRAPGDAQFQNAEIAFKYKMSAVQAGLGIGQMERIDELITYKRQIFRWYDARLSARNDLTLNAEPPGVENSFWMVTIIPDPALRLDKFAIQTALKTLNIDTRPFFSPLSTLPAFANRPEATRLTSHNDRGGAIAAGGLNLPSGYHMTEDKVDQVCRALDHVLAHPPLAPKT